MGRWVGLLVLSGGGVQADEATRLRRSHPGFPFVSLLLIQEIMNRRLFSNIRETKQLTYDANFR